MLDPRALGDVLGPPNRHAAEDRHPLGEDLDGRVLMVVTRNEPDAQLAGDGPLGLPVAPLVQVARHVRAGGELAEVGDAPARHLLRRSDGGPAQRLTGWTTGRGAASADFGGSDPVVALVQTPAMAPSVLPAVTAGDLLDRRKLRFSATRAMVADAALFAPVIDLDRITPWLVLPFLMLDGTGSATTRPTRGAVIPPSASGPSSRRR